MAHKCQAILSHWFGIFDVFSLFIYFFLSSQFNMLPTFFAGNTVMKGGIFTYNSPPLYSDVI